MGFSQGGEVSRRAIFKIFNSQNGSYQLFSVPANFQFFSSLPSGLIIFCLTPTRSHSLAFVGVSHRGNAFPRF